jgi:hypothetical protein
MSLQLSPQVRAGHLADAIQEDKSGSIAIMQDAVIAKDRQPLPERAWFKSRIADTLDRLPHCAGQRQHDEAVPPGTQQNRPARRGSAHGSSASPKS